MRSISPRPAPSAIEFTMGKVWFLGLLVCAGWAGCKANFDGFANPLQDGAAGGRTGTDGATDGLTIDGPTDFDGTTLDGGDLVLSDGAAGGSIQSSDSGLRDAGGVPDAGASGGAGGHSTGTAGAGGTGALPDAAPAVIDAPLGGSADASGTGGKGGDAPLTGGSTGGTSNAGGTGGTLDGASGGTTGVSADAGLDAGLVLDAYLPADTAVVPEIDASAWHLVWSDEFDGALNAGASPSQWNALTWEPGTVNNEEQKYTARPENIFHDGEGHLILRGLHDSLGIGPTTYPYTSGRIQTDGKFEFKFGRVEIRAKLPAGQGSFPGMVLMGTQGGWPQCGEIGLMEQYGQDKGSLYCSTYSGSQSDLAKKVTVSNAAALSTEFHTFALEWYADHMVFFIDADEVARRQFAATSPFATANNDFYLILDVALGGNMGGTIDDGAFPMDMILDYVRIYSL